MSVLSSAALLRLVLLTAPVEGSAPAAPPVCETGSRHLELTEATPGEALTVCIHPGLSISFFFDTKLARVELARRERVPVTVSFQDGVAPAGVTFTLVVHPSEAARQVEVTREPRTLSSYREGEQQARTEARQCREEKARLEAECGGQGGLLGLIAQGLLGLGGIADKDLTRSITSRPGNTLTSRWALSYRSGITRMVGGRKVVRLAVEQELQNNGSTPWTPGGAVLVDAKGMEWKALSVGPLGPIAPGESSRVGVEVEATEEEARSTFTLKLWSQEADTGELFDSVTFP